MMSVSGSSFTCDCGIQRSVMMTTGPVIVKKGLQLSDDEKLNIASALADEIDFMEEQSFPQKDIKWVTRLRSKFVDDEGKPK